MNIITVSDLAATVRGRRQQLGWSQGQLAASARVSRQWVNEFERGKETAAVGTVLRVLDALGLELVTGVVSSEPSKAEGEIDLDVHLSGLGRG